MERDTKLFKIVTWSPVEIDYLKSHREDAIDQLSINLNKSRAAINRKLAELDGKPVEKRGKTKFGTKIGRRDDLGISLRSTWEANVMRWLRLEGFEVLYEPRVFFFDGVKSGTVSYCPDFFVSGKSVKHNGITIKNGSWIEVKGYLKPQDKTRIRRWKKYYPEEFERLIAVVGSETTKAAKFFTEMGVPVISYNGLNKEFKDVIEHWGD